MQFVATFRRATLDLAALVPALPAHRAQRLAPPAPLGERVAAPRIELLLPSSGRCTLVAHWERDPEATVDVCGQTFPAGLLRLRWQIVDPEAGGDG